MVRYVLFHEKEFGIFLGTFLGLAFWSRLDPVGQEMACVFESEEKAFEFVNSWKSSVNLDGLKAIPIECIGDGATRKECKAAGLPIWPIQRFVLVHNTMGVWLGERLWSSDGKSIYKPGTAPVFVRRRDAIRACFGQESPKFKSISEVTNWLNKCRYEAPIVNIMDEKHATCAECVAAGLPGWLE